MEAKNLEMELSNQQISHGEVESKGKDVESTVDNGRKKGGWITFPFLIGTGIGLSIAGGGWYSNITVYAIKKYNINPIAGAQIHNVAAGGFNTFPTLAAILADSFFGSYWVVLVSAFLTLLGGLMFITSAAVPHLTPPSCSPSSNTCQAPSSGQYAFLYTTIAIATIGLGGTRFLLGTVGADQFRKKEDRSVYFNWFMFAIEMGGVFAFTVVVYVQDNVNWALGYGINAIACTSAITLFLLGSRFYVRLMPQGSPFVSIARVFVASVCKANVSIGGDEEYFSENSGLKSQDGAPSASLRFFNRAALIKQDNAHANSQLAKSWKLCTIQEVEDVKKLLKALTIWLGGVLESTIYAVSSSMLPVQALVMDRHLGPNFQIPAGSVYVITLIWTSFTIAMLDRFIFPAWRKYVGLQLTTLRRVGVGYFFNMLGMVAYAILEHQRLGLIRTHHLVDQPHAIAPMSVFWLVIPLILLGFGSAFYLPGEVEFYYQEFPASLRTTSTAMTSLRLGVGYYLSTAIVGVVEDKTLWLPHDINHGRVDNLYWLVSIMGVVNFCIYLTVAKLYKYNNNKSVEDEARGSSKTLT